MISGCDHLLTQAPDDGQVLDGPIDGLTSEQRRIFTRGDEFFGQAFTFETGLGPLFNQTSCQDCHVGDGRGHPSVNLTRFGMNIPGGGFDMLKEYGGPQLQDRSMPGYPPEVIPGIADAISVRGGPIVTGLGLIEAVPDEVIMSHVDEGDADGDGVSGKPNLIEAPDFLGFPAGPYAGKYLGRFGRKAGAINLLQQTVMAYREDMGITSDYMPQENFNPIVGGSGGDPVPNPEIPTSSIEDVVFYLQTLRPPPRRNEADSEVLHGEELFSEIQCGSCHIPSLQTAEHPISALSNKDVPLYSDMLLHDMGPDLADSFVEGEATGVEWRTTPLWGLGIVENVLGGTPFYLHDGRTSSLTEVISLHKGEADSSRTRFNALTPDEQSALIAFLKSL